MMGLTGYPIIRLSLGSYRVQEWPAQNFRRISVSVRQCAKIVTMVLTVERRNGTHVSWRPQISRLRARINAWVQTSQPLALATSRPEVQPEQRALVLLP